MTQYSRREFGKLAMAALPAAGLLLYTGPIQDVIGLVLFGAAVVLHVLRVRSGKDLSGSSGASPPSVAPAG